MLNGSEITNWVKRPAGSNRGAKLRLFCFPYGGGGGSAFIPWANRFPDQVELCVIQPPGREERIAEPPLNCMEEMVEALHTVFPPLLDKPYAFFGHSNGALISFELTRSFRRQGLPLPRHLFVSGNSAPHLSTRARPIYNLPEEEFVVEIDRLNGSPKEILQNPELRELFLPALRADYAIHDTYVFSEEEPLACLITAFGGTEDPLVSPESLGEWSRHTALKFRFHFLPGDHFFIRTSQSLLLGILNTYLEALLRQTYDAMNGTEPFPRIPS